MIINHLDDVKASPVPPEAKGTTKKVLIAAGQGASNFYMRHFTLDPGGATPLHTHPWEHEIFVISGAGTIRVGDEKADLRPGCAVFVPSGELHQINSIQETLEFICMIPPAEE